MTTSRPFWRSTAKACLAPAMTQITPPLGEIADVETSISIKEAARQVLACFNAGDIPRAAGLMTENGVRRAYWGLTIDEENRELARTRIAATPEPRAEEALVRLITVTDVSVLPDGRIAAFVVLNEPLLPPAGPGDAPLHLRQPGRPVAGRRLDRLLDRSPQLWDGGHAGGLADAANRAT